MKTQLHTEKQRQRPSSDEGRTGRLVGTPDKEPRGDALISARTIARLQAAILITAPAVTLAGLVYHPYIPGVLPNDVAVAAAVASDTTRWAIAHLLTAVGAGLLVLAFLAIRSCLRGAGEERWSLLGLPFIVIGSTLYALLPAMEFAPLAAAEVGADIQAIQGALGPWFLPILFTGALLFALGVVSFAVGIARSRILSRPLTRLVVGGLVIMTVARVVPLSTVQFYVQSAAGIVALWPLACVIWNQSEASSGGRS